MKSNNIFNILQSKGLRLFLCTLAMTCATTSYAQDDMDEEEVVTVKTPKRKIVDKNPTIMVKGTIYDFATKKPLAGVRVQTLNDSRYTAMTDAEGQFTIKVPTFATALYVQAPRYMSQQVGIKANDEKQNVVVNMISGNFADMYENGTTYTAESSIISEGNRVTIDEEISQKLGADVRTTMHSGNLDNGASMYIRGINSLNANAQPLVIVDGVELDMQRGRYSLHQGDIFNMLSTISPEDIDKVTVLKNATALYGARGGNGVILIETKRGHSLATRIDVKMSGEVSLLPSTPTMMNATQYRNYAVEQLGTIEKVQKAQASATTMFNFKFLNDNPQAYGYQNYHNDTDWTKDMYRTGITQNYSINVQGGDDVGMYNLSVAYVQAQKNISNANFNRINVRFNTDIQILDNIETKFDMSFSKTNARLYDDGFAANLSKTPITSPTNLALIKSPLLNPYQYNQNINGFTELLSEADDLFLVENGRTKFGEDLSLSNPYSLNQNADGDRKNKNENTFFNVTITPKWNITNELSLSSHFSYYLNRNSQAYYRPNLGMSSFDIEGLGTVYSKTASIFSKETNVISNTHLDWAKKFGAHDVNLMGGFRYNIFAYDNSELASDYQREGVDDKNPQVGVSTNIYSSVAGVDDEWKNMQWYVSGDYNYANKYFATVSLLAESNSRFGKNADGGVKAFGTKWAIFPSVQFGWVLSNEPWFPKSNIYNYVQMHAGFDVSGNDDISNYAAQTAFSSVRYNNKLTGLQLTNVGNDEVKWETTQKWNAGFKVNFFDNRLGINFDYFLHNTSNLLSLKSFTNPIGGINNYWVNDGNLRNQGVEFGISGKPIATKEWQLEVGATLAHYKNTLTALPEKTFTDGARKFTDGTYISSIYGDNNIITTVGNSVGMFYGYKTLGVYSTTEEAKASSLHMVDETGAKVNFEAGDVKFVDMNRDGVIDENDKTIIGDPNPDIYGNIFGKLTYKRFTLNFAFNYSIGNDVYNYQRSILNSGSTLYNQQVAEIDHWRYEGQITNLPKLAFGDPKGNNRFSDRWIEDGSYLRLKSLGISYKVPIPQAWEAWLQGVTVWGEARNLFTLTRYTGEDPEFSISNSHFYQGIDCGNLSLSRSFTLGLKVNL